MACSQDQQSVVEAWAVIHDMEVKLTTHHEAAQLFDHTHDWRSVMLIKGWANVFFDLQPQFPLHVHSCG